MKKKTSSIIIIVFLLLVLVGVAAWYVMYYIIFPMPRITSLVPGKPVAYVNILGLDETMSSIQNSEFVKRVGSSQLWKEFSSSELWWQLQKQKQLWEKQLGIDRDGIVKLMGKNALLAFYSNQGQWDVLLISEVDPLTKMSIVSDSVEHDLALKYELSKEKYKGVELLTIKNSMWAFSYGFIGRAGFLSFNTPILKKLIDAHKGDGESLADNQGFKRLMSSLPRSNVSFYVDANTISSYSRFLALYAMMINRRLASGINHLTPVIQEADAWAGVVKNQNGNLQINQSIIFNGESKSKRKASSSELSDSLPIPSNCLAFALHETLDPENIVMPLERLASSKLRDFRADLLSAFDHGIALAVLEPNVRESQLLPPVLAFLPVRDRKTAETALSGIKRLLGTDSSNLKFNEMTHENITINYSTVLTKTVLPVNLGYAFVNDDLMAISSDLSALRSVIDLSIGKGQPLMESEQYKKALTPIAKPSDARGYVNLRSTSLMVEQAAKLYALQAGFIGKPAAQRTAIIISRNAFILGSWDYMGASVSSKDNMLNVRVNLSNGLTTDTDK